MIPLVVAAAIGFLFGGFYGAALAVVLCAVAAVVLTIIAEARS